MNGELVLHNGTHSTQLNIISKEEGEQAYRSGGTSTEKEKTPTNCEILKWGGWWEITLGYTSVIIHQWTRVF